MFTIPLNLGQVETAKDFTYPPGQYIMKILSVELASNQDGTRQRIQFMFEIVMGPATSNEFAGKKVPHSYQLHDKEGNLTDKGVGFLKKDLCAMAPAEYTEAYLASLGQSLPPDLVGRTLMCTLNSSEFNGRMYTNVRNIGPTSEWQHGGIAGQPAAAPQQAAPQTSLLGAMPQPAAPPAPAPAPVAPQQYAQPAAPAAPAPQQYAQPAAPMQPPAPQYAQPAAPAPQYAPQAPGMPPQPVAAPPAPAAPQQAQQPGLPAPPPPATNVPQQ
jgi:hypothetical protein